MGVVIIPEPPSLERPYDVQTVKAARITPFGAILTETSTRLLGGGFGAAIDTSQWVATNSGAGSASGVANSIATITSGTANSGFGTLTFIKTARFQFAATQLMRGVFRLPATGGANTTRSWGAFNFGTKPAIQDGFYFSYDGTSSTLSVNYAKSGVSTSIASGSFNGEVTSYTLDTNQHTYEIMFQTGRAFFLVDGILLHTVKPTTSILASTLDLNTSSLSMNSAGGTTSASFEVWAHNLSELTSNPPGPQYVHINTNTTTVAKMGPGRLQRVTINSPGSASNIATVYDNTAASGPIMAVITTLGGNGAAATLDYNITFVTGLTIVTSGGTAADLTITYD